MEFGCASRWCVSGNTIICRWYCSHSQQWAGFTNNYQFSCEDNVIETTDKYKYHGLTFLDYTEMAKSVSKAASRALGVDIAKCKALSPSCTMH